MEFIVKKKDFLNALSKIQTIADKKTTLPILSHVMLSAQEQSIKVSATDLEVGFEGVYPAQIITEGSVTVPAKKLYEIAKEFPSEDISIQEKDNNWLHIHGGDSKYNLFGLPGNDFPGLPQCEHLQEIQISSAKLRRMIDCTIFSTSAENAMFNTSGVCLEKFVDKDHVYLRMVSTDGHRLSIVTYDIEHAENLDFEESIIISKKGIMEINRIIEEEEYVTIGFSQKVGMVKTENGLIVVRLLENKFPDYKRAIPVECDIKLTLDRIPFLEMMRRMSIMSTERHKGVRFQINPGSLEIFSTNPELGDSQEKKKVDYDGPELVVGFNPKYIIEVLNVMESEKVELNFSDQENGCLIKGEMDQGFLGMVMPMKLS